MTFTKREQERQALTAVLETLEENGYRIVNVHDSEEWMGRRGTEQTGPEGILNWAMAADMGSIHFRDPKGKRFAIHMVYGNSPWEVICDMSGQDVATLTRAEALINPIQERAERAYQ